VREIPVGVFLRKLTAGGMMVSAITVAVIGILLVGNLTEIMIVVIFALIVLISGRILWGEDLLKT